MVDIRPLRGLIYNSAKVGDLAGVVSPPYDVITSKDRLDMLERHPHNIVRLILPQGRGGQKYENASRVLDNWLDDSILIHDDSECFYVLRIDFVKEGKHRRLTGIIGLTALGDYGTGRVLRHEKTLSGPKKDRYRLLEACRTNFGLIYTTYRQDTDIRKILDSSSVGSPFISIKPCYDRRLSFRVWRISGAGDISAVRNAMKSKSILIADGHHRYETSLAYSKKLRKDTPGGGPGDHVLTFFLDSSQEGLSIYPTHRSITFEDFTGIDAFLDRLPAGTDARPVHVGDARDIDSILARAGQGSGGVFVLYTADKAFMLRTSRAASSPGRPDVFILHDEIIGILEKTYGRTRISFDHVPGRIMEDVRSGSSHLGVFLNPPTIRDMEDICYSGGLMPQKSTYFWPKPCTGLVMYSFRQPPPVQKSSGDT